MVWSYSFSFKPEFLSNQKLVIISVVISPWILGKLSWEESTSWQVDILSSSHIFILPPCRSPLSTSRSLIDCVYWRSAFFFSSDSVLSEWTAFAALCVVLVCLEPCWYSLCSLHLYLFVLLFKAVLWGSFLDLLLPSPLLDKYPQVISSVTKMSFSELTPFYLKTK